MQLSSRRWADQVQVVTAKMEKTVAALLRLAICQYARTATVLRTVVVNTRVHRSPSAAQLAARARMTSASHLVRHLVRRLVLHLVRRLRHQRRAPPAKINVPPPRDVAGASPPTTMVTASRVTCLVRFPAHTTATKGGTLEDTAPRHPCVCPLSRTTTFVATSSASTEAALRHLLFLTNKHATRTTVRTLLPGDPHWAIARKFWPL